MATSLETVVNFNHIADRILAELDYKSLWNLEQTSTKWSRYIKEPKLWLRLCIKAESKWFKNTAGHTNQNFIQYKTANLQWYQLLEDLDDFERGLRNSISMFLKLRYKNAVQLTHSPTYINIAPFTFAARWGNLALAKQIVAKIDPFKKMNLATIGVEYDVEHGEVHVNEVAPFDPDLIPFDIAMKSGQVKVVQFLLETYSQLNTVLNEGNNTPLEYAAEKGHNGLANVLLSFPLKENVKTRAFHLAIGKESYKIAFMINKLNFFQSRWKHILFCLTLSVIGSIPTNLILISSLCLPLNTGMLLFLLFLLSLGMLSPFINVFLSLFSHSRPKPFDSIVLFAIFTFVVIIVIILCVL